MHHTVARARGPSPQRRPPLPPAASHRRRPSKDASKGASPLSPHPSHLAPHQAAEKTGKTPVRRLLRHGDRKGGAEREPQPTERLHPDGAMATLVPPTRLPALGSGDALAAAAVLGVSLGA